MNHDALTGIEPLVPVKHAARVLGITPNTLWRMIRDGEISTVRVGMKRVMLEPAELLRYIETRRSPARRRGQAHRRRRKRSWPSGVARRDHAMMEPRPQHLTPSRELPRDPPTYYVSPH
jgi:excisionase family DNA binding protein